MNRDPRTISRASEPSARAADLELMDDLSGRIAPDDSELRSWFDRYSQQHRIRLATDLALTRELAEPGDRVLEYGAVPLIMTAALDAIGYEVRALDIAPERFSRSISELALDVRRCDIETEAVPFPEGRFDVILFNELFEHLRIDPIFTLGEALRVLTPGGHLLLSTPNLRSFRGLRNLILRDQAHASSAGVHAQYEKLETLGHMGHVREYTVTEVVDFLRRVGFSVTRVIYRGGHGAGIVGIAERVAPSLRPFFTLVAFKEPAAATPGREEASGRP